MLEKVLSKLVFRKEDLPEKGNTTFLNPYSYLVMRKSISSLDKMDGICIDGSALCVFLKLFGIANVERISFDNTSLAVIVFEQLNENSGSIYVVGSNSEQANAFRAYLESNYPKMIICKVRNGYFASNDEKVSEAREIASINPDVLVCGMGTPLQEDMLYLAKEAGWRGLGYTCGGFIHQTAKGGKEYYPRAFNELNIRFVYRIIDEPKLIKRYTIDYGKFVLFFIWDLINYKVYKK